MIELGAQIERRGGTPLDPIAYKRMYLDRLWQGIQHRVENFEVATRLRRSIWFRVRVRCSKASRSEAQDVPGQWHR